MPKIITQLAAENLSSSLIIVHSIARIDAENISTRLRACPIKVPVIISRHLNPSALLKVIQQYRFVHVGAKANFHPLILIVSDSAKCKFALDVD